MSQQDEMSTGMKWMVLAIFLLAIGLVVGLVGLVADWAMAKWIGVCSAILLGIVLYLSAHMKEQTLERLLLGRRKN